MFSDPKFWVAASFILFIAFVGRIGWAKITEMLDSRTTRIRSELNEAQRLRAEAQAMLASAEAERAAALTEASQMLERARLEAERLASATAAEAEAAARRRERMAMDRIAAAEASAVTEVRNAAADLAALAVRDVIAAKYDAAADEAMLDKTIKGLPSVFRAA